MRPAIGFVLLSISCHETAAPPPVTPPPRLVVGSSTTPRAEPIARPDAGSPPARIPAPLIHLAEADERLLLGPFVWPPKGTSVFVGQLSIAFLWKTDVAEDRDLMPTDRTPTRALSRDVDGDGVAELVVFLAPMTQPVEPFQDKSTTWIFGVRPDGHVARMSALEYQVMGANDERSLDAELASLGKLGPTKDVPVERVVTRLQWATADELRSLVPAKGVQQCHRQAMKRSCTTISRAAIDAKSTRRIVEKTGAFAKYVTDDMTALQRPACEVTKRIVCSSSVGGPQGAQWIFERRGADLELVEIGTWAEDT